jgi:hypothetical protein
LLAKYRGTWVQDDGVGYQRLRSHAQLLDHFWRRQHRAAVRTHCAGALYIQERRKKMNSNVQLYEVLFINDVIVVGLNL